MKRCGLTFNTVGLFNSFLATFNRRKSLKGNCKLKWTSKWQKISNYLYSDQFQWVQFEFCAIPRSFDILQIGLHHYGGNHPKQFQETNRMPHSSYSLFKKGMLIANTVLQTKPIFQQSTHQCTRSQRHYSLCQHLPMVVVPSELTGLMLVMPISISILSIKATNTYMACSLQLPSLQDSETPLRTKNL